MEDFFEKLNSGDREGAVALMDEKTEMRVHVGDSVQMLRGVERVGGWFLRGDAGLRMIPGGIRDTGNTYEADLLVVRPGAPGQGAGESEAVPPPTSSGVGTGMMISSPTTIRSGSLIVSVFAASSSSSVRSNSRAILESVSPSWMT